MTNPILFFQKQRTFGEFDTVFFSFLYVSQCVSSELGKNLAHFHKHLLSFVLTLLHVQTTSKTVKSKSLDEMAFLKDMETNYYRYTWEII